jgi:Kef-type K+ transport system membrane component KefB
MLEYGFNKTEYGKIVLAACFINDLGTVLAVGFIFAPFSLNTALFAVLAVAVFAALPRVMPILFNQYGGRASEFETKYLLLLLFALGTIAAWADSEAVLPAYIAGMLLAGRVGKDHALIRRIRTLTLGLMTPFYFIRAGSFVSVAALIAAPIAFLALLVGKTATKCVGIYPVTKLFGSPQGGHVHHALDVTGLTFGTISALFGLSHGIIDQSQYSVVVAGVVASAVVPTMIANAFFMPRHLLQGDQHSEAGCAGPPTKLTDGP